MDVSYITAFVESIQNLYSTMMMTSVSVLKPRMVDGDPACSDVSGVIGMSGDVVGTVVLGFPIPVAEQTVAKFAGMPMEAGTDEFADAVGELVNMIAGAAKAKFDGKSVSISCPSVVVGAQHRVFQQKDCPLIDIPCQSELGVFSVFVSLKEVAA